MGKHLTTIWFFLQRIEIENKYKHSLLQYMTKMGKF